MFIDNIYYRALRIHAAKSLHYYAVQSSDIQPLPHQIDAVYCSMLQLHPIHFLLADDPGAGKTIMTGLLIKELFTSRRLTSCLIVSPGSLAEQWQDELARKFFMHFDFFTEHTQSPFCIAKLDTLARSETLTQKAVAHDWDLVVIDEAHKLSAQVFANKTDYTKRFQLGRNLAKHTRDFLLLTATPHNGKPEDYAQFISLLGTEDSRSKRRLLKENLMTFDLTPIFPEREARTVSYTLSYAEAELYEDVTQYVRTQFNLADKLSKKRQHSIGFAMTILQRRLASSPEAVYQSLAHRLQRLEERLSDSRTRDYDIYDYDEFTSGEVEEREDNAVNFVSASENDAQLAEEIATLRHLVDKAAELRASGQDRKWSELSHLLMSSDFAGHKLIIFTEHRDTLRYLKQRITALPGLSDSVVVIHGGMSTRERRQAEHSFMTDEHAQILIATDAAGEGINLQCANLMINYDISWNPNRLEQRFGRIHRIGQRKMCMMYNLVASNTREGAVLERLLTKLDAASRDLGGKVFDVLGSIVFGDMPLHDIMTATIRGESPHADLNYFHVQQLIHERAKDSDNLTKAHVMTIARNLNEDRARRLHPQFIAAFFLEAFRYLGGRAYPREPGRYELFSVPAVLTQKDSRIRHHYSRVAFDPKDGAEPIMQGHPLLAATVAAIVEEASDPAKLQQPDTQHNSSEIEQAAMNAVMTIEAKLGNSPQDVSAQKIGYDIESTTPQGTLRLIEVKGRRTGARAVTLTAGEVRSALAYPEAFILAIVEVDGDNTHTTYLSRPFRNEPDDAAISVTFSIPALVKQSECAREMEDNL